MPTASRTIPWSRDTGLYKMQKWDEMNTFLYLSPFDNCGCGVTSCFKLLLSWLLFHNGLYFKLWAKINFLFIKKKSAAVSFMSISYKILYCSGPSPPQSRHVLIFRLSHLFTSHCTSFFMRNFSLVVLRILVSHERSGKHRFPFRDHLRFV